MSDTLAPIDFADLNVTIEKKKPAVYIRVSTKDQNIESQKQELLKWLLTYKQESLETIAALQDDRTELERWMRDAASWYIDEGKSGDRIHDRPAFNAMQEAIRSGKHDTVIVWKLDRLSRKMAHGITCLSEWLERGVQLISTTQQIDVSGPMGKVLAAFLLGCAEMEQEVRRERQAAGIAAKKKSHPGFYKRVSKKGAERRRGHRKVSPARVLELKQKGHTVTEISNILAVSRQSVYRYLKEAEKAAPEKLTESPELPSAPQE